jgi:general secretion pathway protein A
MIRGRSRKLLSRILWINPEVEDDDDFMSPAVSDAQANGHMPGQMAGQQPGPQLAEPPQRTSRSRSGQNGPAQAQPDLYNEHFGFAARPFALTPDPDFLFWPPGHLRAYTMLEYGVMTHAPITLITGEVGAGKTTLLLHLLRSLGRDVRVGLISNPNGSRSELLRWVLHSLEQPAELDETYVDLFSRFQNFLFAEYAAGRRVILVFDEAQNLSAEALEELRMFININSGKDELLQLVLIGQPELREMVSRRDMRQFAQRIAASYHLTAMDLKTIRAYIPHRLHAVGCDRRIFSPSAVRLIFEQTRGIPRLVNQLCDLSLVYAFSKGKMSVSVATVQQVLNDGAFFAVHAAVDEALITE